jgi:hypothetical protein
MCKKMQLTDFVNKLTDFGKWSQLKETIIIL